jgi:hypothetical protein
MTVEIHAKLITLLAEVDELERKEAALKSEKLRHLGAKRPNPWLYFPTVARNDFEDHRMAWRANYRF